MIELPTFSELEFMEKDHVYKLNGIEIPSVTQVMEPLSTAHYSGINAAVLDKAAARGTAVHNAIENYLLFGIDDIPGEFGGYYEAFKKWWTDASPILVGTEHRVYHKVARYAGTIDLVCEVGGKLMLVDIKTSSQIIEMLTRVQLEAYQKAVNSHQMPIEGKGILHLTRDGKYTLNAKYEASDTEAWKVFIGLLAIRNYEAKYRR